jgi:dihydrofolate reductase
MTISIDGFVAGPDGALDWIFGRDSEARAWSVETVGRAGLHIMGSRTFRDMAAFWPTSADVFAPPMNRIPKAVFSRQGAAILPQTPCDDAGVDPGKGPPAEFQPGAESWAQAYVASGDLAAEIAGLKAQEGDPIMAHGGASFARSLIAQGLVDQFTLLVRPVAVGRGLPIFCDLAAPTTLRLVSSTAFPGGSVAQIYRTA